MAKSKSKSTKSADERDMSAHIPDGTDAVMDQRLSDDDRDMASKTDDLGAGLHPTSKTFGTVVSDYDTDAEGKTPEDVAEMTDRSHKSDDDK